MRSRLPFQYDQTRQKGLQQRSSNWETQFIAVALGITLTIALSFCLFAWGVPVTRWHGIIYFVILTSLIVGLEWKDHEKSLRLVFLQWLVHAIAILVVMPFIDLGGDGMGSHQEGILAFESEWNPISDPYFLESEKLRDQYPVVEESFWVGRGLTRNFGYLFSAIIAKFTGIHETGKSLHLISLWMAFCASMSVAERLFKLRKNQWISALIATLNPVICYQFLSYWQDGFLAGVYTALIMSAILWLLSPSKLIYAAVFVALSFLISGLKLAGVGFAGLTALGIYSAIFFRGGMKVYGLFSLGFLNLFLIGLAGVLLGAWTFQSKLIAPIAGKLELYASKDINAGGSSYNQIEAYYHMNRLQVFMYSMFSRTKPVPRDIELKTPFTFDREEVETFYNFFEDPRGGGLGLFYGGLLLIGVGLFITGFRENRDESIVALFIAGLILFPLFFIPTYWARWIPHTWLLPLVLALPRWMSLEQIRNESKARYSRRLFSLRFFTSRIWLRVFVAGAFANTIVILVPYIAGNVFGTWMLNQQLSLVSGFPKPLWFGNGDYPSNRNWLIERDIPYEMTWDPDHWKQPYLQFYRTNTRIFIDPAQLDKPQAGSLTLRTELDHLKQIASFWQPRQWLSDVWVDLPETTEPTVTELQNLETR